MEADDFHPAHAPKLIEYLRDHVTLNDADGTIRYSNASMTPMLGYNAEDYVGRRPEAFIHPDDVAKIQAFYQELAAEKNATHTIEIRGRHRQGHDVWLEVVATNKLDDPEIGAIVTSSRDISERKVAQDALAEERNLLRTMIDSLPDLIWVKNLQHRYIMRNAASGNILSANLPGDILGKTDAEILPDQNWQAFYAEEEEIFKTGNPLVNHHEQFTALDGSSVWIATTKVPLRNLNGDIIGLVGASRDITERKLREQQLRYHGSLQENVSDAVISTDLQFRIQSWNPAAERIYGWSAADAVGKEVDDVLQTGYNSPTEPILMQDELLRDGRWQGEVIQHRRDGSPINILASVTRLKDDDGVPFGIVAVNHDITKRKETEQALHTKLEQEVDFQEALKALHEITIELTQIDQLDNFYRRAVELGRSRLGFDRVALFLYDAQRNLAIGTFGTSVEGTLTDERSFQFPPDLDGLMMRAFRLEDRFAFEDNIPLTHAYEVVGSGWNATSILWDGTQSQGWLVADNLLRHKPASKAQLDILALYSLSLGTLLARKKTDAALRQSEVNLQAIMNSASFGVFLSDRSGVIRLANQLAQEYSLLFYGQPLAVETTLFDLGLDDRASIERLLERVYAGEHISIEYEREFSSELYVLDLRYDPVMVANGDVIGVTVSFIDITARKQAQKALETYAAEVHDLYNKAPCGYHSLDANGIIVQINDTELNWLGYAREAIVGKMGIADFMTAESQASSEISFPEFKQTGWVKDQEFDLVRRDGSIISVLVNASAVTNPDGSYLMSRSTLFDVTERKRAEAALRQSETKFRSFVEDAPEAIIISDENGLISLVNAEAEKVFGYQRDEMIGQTVEMLVPDAVRLEHVKHRVRYAENPHVRGRGDIKDLRGQRKNGEIFFADVELSYIETGDSLLIMTFVADISERKQAEEVIRASEARYRLLADNITDLIVRIDRWGNYEYISPSSRTMLGYDPEELVGTSGFALVHPDDVPIVAERQRALLDPAVSHQTFTFRYRHKDGHYLWVETTGQLIWSEARNEALGFIIIARDITERHQTQEALRQSEALYRLLADNISDVITRTDVKGNFQYVSPSARTMLGYEPSELLGKPGRMLIYPDDQVDVLRAPESVDPIGDNATPIYRALRKDGKDVWVETRTQSIFAEDTGEVIGFISVSRDMTQQHKSQAALRESEELLRKVLDNLPVGVWLVAPDGTIALSNPAGEELWKTARFGKDDLQSSWWPQIGRKIKPTGAAARALALGESTLNQEIELESFDGVPKYLLSSWIPMRDHDANIVGAIVVNDDVTIMKLAENTLRAAFEKEKELGELKSRFVSMASHEFRTPLATILSSSEMLLSYRSRMDEERIDYKLTTIAGQVKHLTSIVEDVLDLTRIQTNKVEFKPIETDLDRLCREIIDEFRSQPDIRQSIVYSCEKSPALVTLDKKLIRQVFINLISNATKYSPADRKVFITLEYRQSDALLRVRDQGIGIPEADLRHLFEPFHRAANVGTVSGTGLGLSITKQAIELHGGTIRVESEINVGTTFTVTLPISHNAGRDDRAESSSDTR